MKRTIAAITAIVIAAGTLVAAGTGLTETSAAPGLTVMPACKAALVEMMRDPDSVTFENLEGPEPLEEPSEGWSIVGEYRARNGFGGMNSDVFFCTTDETGNIDELVTGESLED